MYAFVSPRESVGIVGVFLFRTTKRVSPIALLYAWSRGVSSLFSGCLVSLSLLLRGCFSLLCRGFRTAVAPITTRVVGRFPHAEFTGVVELQEMAETAAPFQWHVQRAQAVPSSNA